MPASSNGEFLFHVVAGAFAGAAAFLVGCAVSWVGQRVPRGALRLSLVAGPLLGVMALSLTLAGNAGTATLCILGYGWGLRRGGLSDKDTAPTDGQSSGGSRCADA